MIVVPQISASHKKRQPNAARDCRVGCLKWPGIADVFEPLTWNRRAKTGSLLPSWRLSPRHGHCLPTFDRIQQASTLPESYPRIPIRISKLSPTIQSRSAGTCTPEESTCVTVFFSTFLHADLKVGWRSPILEYKIDPVSRQPHKRINFRRDLRTECNFSVLVVF